MNKIEKHFPFHVTYIELFFGAGGFFFDKTKAKYNIVNDNDSEVYNVFRVCQDSPKELYEFIYNMPMAEDLWFHWKANKETDPIKKAARFLFLSNFGFMGKPNTMRMNNKNAKRDLLNGIKTTNDLLWDVDFMNTDFRNVLKKIPFKDNDKPRTFIYADPPYTETTDTYEGNWTKQDTFDLFKMLSESGIKFAISEFDHPFVLDLAKEYNLHSIAIGERMNLKDRRMEMLYTNYLLHPEIDLIHQ